MQYMRETREAAGIAKIVFVGKHGFVRLEIEPPFRTDHNTDQVVIKNSPLVIVVLLLIVLQNNFI